METRRFFFLAVVLCAAARMLASGHGGSLGALSDSADSIAPDSLGIQLMSANDPAQELLDRAFVPPTPSSAVYSKHLGPQPALSTGAVSLSVPIYVIDYKGVSIPLTLEYQSNGVKVYDNPFPCGYGWSLSPGLRVTRTVIGRPDELFNGLSSYVGSSEYEKQWLSVANNSSYNNSALLDPGTDVFHIHLPGASAVMSLVRGAGPQYAFAGPDSTISMRAADNGLEELEVTDGAGVKYVFKAMERAANGICTGWMLKEMELPFGQKITFEWKEHANPNHRMGEASSSFTDMYHGIDMTGFALPDAVPSPVSQRLIDPHSHFYSLESIAWPGGKAAIGYGRGADGTGQLITGITIYDHKGAKVRECALSYHQGRAYYADRQSGTADKLCLLKSIAIGGEGAYEFEYDSRNFLNEYAQDLWGYYNGMTSNSSLLPKMKIASRLLFGSSDIDSVKIEGGDRRADEQAMQAYILKKVTYPTGGTTAFEYEAHRFENPCANSTGYGITDLGGIDFEKAYKACAGGGLRVKRTVTSAGDGSPAITRSYAYGRGGDGVAECSAVPSLFSFVTQTTSHAENNLKYRTITVSASSNASYLDLGQPAIWYDAVTETTANGKTEYTFCLEQESSYNFKQELQLDLPSYPAAPPLRRPATLYATPQAAPQMASCKTYARVGNAYVATSYVENEYSWNRTTPADGQLDVRRRVYCMVGGCQPDYPYGNMSDGYQYNGGPAGSGLFSWNNNDVYDSEYYTLYFCSAPQLSSRETIVYGDDGSESAMTETFKYLSGSGLPTEIAVNDGAETRVTRISYTLNAQPSSLIEASQAAVLEQMRAKHLLSMPVMVSSTAQGASSSSQICYAAAGASFAPSKVVARRDGQTMAMGQWTTDARGCVTSSKTLGQEKAEIDWDADGLYILGIRKIAADTLAWTYEHKPLVGLSSATDPAGVTTRYAYDAHGRLASVSVDGHGAVASYQYGLVTEGAQANFVRESKMLSADASRSVSTASYLDGLGREWQSVLEAAGQFEAVCSVTDFDAEGRPSVQWLPLPAAARLDGRDNLENLLANHYHNGYLYTALGYSPRQGSEPSEIWRPGPMLHTSCSPARTRLYASAASGKHACRLYTATLDGTLQKGAMAAAGRFLIKATIDEDGRELLEFTNRFGQKVLDRRVLSAGEYADTYYCYDPYGRLRYMLSPECSKALEASSGTEFTAAHPAIDKLAYYYAYHPFSLAKTVRKLPGAAEILACCDSEGTPVLTQDGNQRARGVWAYTILDGHKRPALQGEAAMSTIRARSVAAANPVAVRSASSPCGYTAQGLFRPSNPDVATYYDDYGFCSDAALSFLGQGGARHSSAKGRATGMRQGGRLSVTYYDLLGSPVQQSGYNQYGYVDHAITAYNFDQTPRRVEKRHRRSASQSVTEVYAYSYDALGRETLVTHSINGGDARAISASEYNSLRQLSKRASGGLSVSYGYGIGGALNFISSAPFTQRIARETMACASGLVTSVSSKFGSDAFATASYEYDNLGRLAQAKEGGSVRSSFAYNLNGSPTSISRCGVADREGGEAVYGYIDRAELAYDGNRLASSSDRAQYLSYAGANDLPNGEGEYGYDANGNMAFDTGRGIDSVAYNRLNLPVRVDFSDRSVVTFEYDNLGAKLAEVDSIPALAIIRPPIGLKTFPSIGGEIALKPVCKVTRTEYCGSCVYVGGKLARLLFPGGYATPKGGGEGFDYHYYVCDYLGSVRAVVAEDGAVEETNDYYPYGMQKPGANGALGQAQPYKYGGKERLSAAGLNLYDFGPRALYSPAAQFASMDPKCEDYPHLSPYLYCAANPVNAIDPTGKNYIVIKNDQDSTYTVEAVYIVDKDSEKSVASANSAVEFWNRKKGTADDGYKICFNLTIKLVDTKKIKTSTSDRVSKFRPYLNMLSFGPGNMKYNTYEVKDEKTFKTYYKSVGGQGDPNSVGGTTKSHVFISLNEKRFSKYTGAHEIGHTLGLEHSEFGLMSPGQYQHESNPSVSEYELQLIIDNGIIVYPLQ